MSKKRITELTQEQYDKLAAYRKLGVDIGLGAGDELDETEVLHHINAHLKANGHTGKFIETLIVCDSPFQAIKLHGDKGINSNNAFYGQHDSSWLTNYLFYRLELGLIEETEPMVHLMELAKRVNWFWINDVHQTAIVCRKPKEVVRGMNMFLSFQDSVSGETITEETAVLHRDLDMAIKFRDGTGLYFLYDTFIPEQESWIVTTPASEITMERILKIQNTDLRSVAIRKVGIERAFETIADKKVLSEKTLKLGGRYELYEVDFGTGPRNYLRMVCPSKGEIHIEGVPNECRTVDSALGWQCRDADDAVVFSSSYTYREPYVQS